MADSATKVTAKPRRRWWQFSLGSLLVLMTALALWLGFWADSARRQKQAVERIKKHDGQIGYSWQIPKSPAQTPAPPGPKWVRDWLGIDYLDHVTHAVVNEESIADSDLADLLNGLPRLTLLEINGVSKITDAGVARVASHRGLERLRLNCPQMTDAGLAHLNELPNLDSLSLESDHISDAGLIHLRGMKKLYFLELNCPITDAGMEHLTGLTNLLRLRCLGAPSDTERRKMAEALRQTTTVDFMDEPLKNVCDYFTDYHFYPGHEESSFRFDRQTIEAAHREPAPAVSAQLNGACLSEALTRMLQPHELGWYVDGGVVVITTAEVDAQRHTGVNKLREVLPKLKQIQYCW